MRLISVLVALASVAVISGGCGSDSNDSLFGNAEGNQPEGGAPGGEAGTGTGNATDGGEPGMSEGGSTTQGGSSGSGDSGSGGTEPSGGSEPMGGVPATGGTGGTPSGGATQGGEAPDGGEPGEGASGGEESGGAEAGGAPSQGGEPGEGGAGGEPGGGAGGEGGSEPTAGAGGEGGAFSCDDRQTQLNDLLQQLRACDPSQVTKEDSQCEDVVQDTCNCDRAVHDADSEAAGRYKLGVENWIKRCGPIECLFCPANTGPTCEKPGDAADVGICTSGLIAIDPLPPAF